MYAGVYWRFLTAVPEKHEMTARHKMIVYLQKKIFLVCFFIALQFYMVQVPKVVADLQLEGK